MLARSLEGVLLIAIIVAVWLVMVMPVVIYFLVSISIILIKLCVVYRYYRPGVL